MGVSEFTVEVFQNQYLYTGAREVNAIVAVTSAGSASEARLRRVARAADDIALRVWTPQNATVQFLRQVAPTVEDLTARRTRRHRGRVTT